MQNARDLKEYKGELSGALGNEFLRTAMDNFAMAYRVSRAKAFAGMDVDALVQDIARGKDQAMGRMDELYEEFRKNAERLGITVHLAKTGQEANEIIGRIAEKAGVKRIVKSKSMTAEETLLNHHLEDLGLDVVETDLG
ncbi:MAG: LUD domain-containing protein, partial [Humidesulfovibrio sp.]|nr:LUD domain-containing protein [Humidesulfovibrio sp.]